MTVIGRGRAENVVSRIIRVGTIKNWPLSKHLKEVRRLVIPISGKSLTDRRKGWCKGPKASKTMPAAIKEDLDEASVSGAEWERREGGSHRRWTLRAMWGQIIFQRLSHFRWLNWGLIARFWAKESWSDVSFKRLFGCCVENRLSEEDKYKCLAVS